MARCILIAGLIGIGFAGAAEAGLEICNQTDKVQSVAIGYKGDTDWTSEGWWNVEPGDCAAVVGGDLKKRFYYYFADSEGGGFRGQNFVFCTQNDAFTIVGDTNCVRRGYEEGEFREIDTGETATQFTLTLVDDGGPVDGAAAGAKGPGGSGGSGTRVGDGANVAEGDTQSVDEEAPDTAVVAANETDLQSGPPAGQHGEAFEVAALFQGCELEEGRAYCGFHADGTKMRAFYNGPTPKELLYALEDMAMNTPVTVAGDQVERDRMHTAVVLREVKVRSGGDPLADLRKRVQGDWVARSDRKSEITIRGSEIYVRYDGEFRLTRFMELAERCDGLNGSGPVLIQTSLRDRDPKCYRVGKIEARALELVPVAGGETLQFQRAR